MFNVTKYYETVERLEKNYNCKVLPKSESKLCKVLSKIAFWDKNFMNRGLTFCVPFYRRVFMSPNDLENKADGYRTIRHEEIHLKQVKYLTSIGFNLLYLFCLPIAFTFRAVFEYYALLQDIEVYMELYPSAYPYAFAKQLSAQFTSGSYFWMFVSSNFIYNKFVKHINRLKEQKK